MDDKDLIAVLAMVGILSRGSSRLSDKEIAEWAYDMVDAMMDEREKRDGN